MIVLLTFEKLYHDRRFLLFGKGGKGLNSRYEKGVLQRKVKEPLARAEKIHFLLFNVQLGINKVHTFRLKFLFQTLASKKLTETT